MPFPFHTKSKIVCIVVFSINFVMFCSKDKSPITSDSENGCNFSPNPQYDVEWPGLSFSDWPMYLHDPQHTGRSPFRGPQQGEIVWRFDTGGEVYGAPALSQNGTIFFGSYSGYLFALSPSGNSLWQFRCEGKLQSNVLVDRNEVVYLSSLSSGVLYALHSDGKIKWMLREKDAYFQWFNISKDGSTLYAIRFYEWGTNNVTTNLYAINTSDGSLKWIYEKEATNKGFYNEPAISLDGTIYCVGFDNSDLYAILPDGKLKWKYEPGAESQGSAPSVDDDGNIYLSTPKFLVCISPQGSEKWRFERVVAFGGYNFNFNTPTISYDGTIHTIESGLGDYLVALDSYGCLKWRFKLKDTASGVVMNSPVIDKEGTVYIGMQIDTPSDSTNFIAINSDGSLKFQMSLRNPDGTVPDITATPCISSDERIYIGCDRPMGKYVFAIQ
jgi:outer membrane protein assembly factor BamB